MTLIQNIIIGYVVVIKEMQFFCFPFLLFGGELVWTKTGMTDLNHLDSGYRRGIYFI